MLSEKTKKEIKNRLLNKFELNKIILFGSQAIGKADKRSDIDLLIIVPKINNRIKLMGEIRNEFLSLDYAFDIITVTPKEFEIDKEIPGTVSRFASLGGITLYEA